jgi:hypothetical protein
LLPKTKNPPAKSSLAVGRHCNSADSEFLLD